MRQRRHLAALALVLTANFLGLTFHVRTGSHNSVVRDGLMTVLAGGQDAVTGAARGVWSLGGAVSDARGVRDERDQLARRVARLEWELTVERGMRARARGFTEFDAESFGVGEPVPAEVIGFAASPLDRSITVNRGRIHGVRADSPVMSASGLLGRLVAAAPNAGQVELLLAPTAAAAALTAESRVPGIVRAARFSEDEGDALRLDYVPVGQNVVVGEEVISSGLDGMYPKGLPIGRVVRVRRGAGMLLDILVEPAADFDSLERVFLLDPVEAPFPEVSGPEGAETPGSAAASGPAGGAAPE